MWAFTAFGKSDFATISTNWSYSVVDISHLQLHNVKSKKPTYPTSNKSVSKFLKQIEKGEVESCYRRSQVQGSSGEISLFYDTSSLKTNK